jgi:hypothetical protein
MMYDFFTTEDTESHRVFFLVDIHVYALEILRFALDDMVSEREDSVHIKRL